MEEGIIRKESQWRRWHVVGAGRSLSREEEGIVH